LKFFIVSLIVLPFLPDEKIGPFNAFNPHTVGLLVTSLTGIGWVGYIAVRAFGASRGLPLAGFAGGFVSSTATTADMVRRAQDPALRRPAIAAALLSKISSLLVLMVLVAAVSQDLIAVLIYPFLAMIVALLATVGIYSRIGRPSQRVTELDEPAKPAERIHLGRAFALKPALILAGIITAASITSRGAALWFGSQAVIAVSAVTGTVTPQAPVLASADLVHQHLVTASDAMIGIVTALATNTIFKIVLTYMSAGRTMGALIAKTLLPATALMVVVAVITYRCLAV
jgi:uncharacterized membrane protein (DUF4010 family)